MRSHIVDLETLLCLCHVSVGSLRALELFCAYGNFLSAATAISASYVAKFQSLYDHFSVYDTRFFFGCWIGFLVSNLPLTRMFRNRSFSKLPSGLSSRRESCSSSGKTSSNEGSETLSQSLVHSSQDHLT